MSALSIRVLTYLHMSVCFAKALLSVCYLISGKYSLINEVFQVLDSKTIFTYIYFYLIIRKNGIELNG